MWNDPGRAALAFAAWLGLIGSGPALAEAAYPAMAPVEQYLMADRSEEIAQARAAAPASISDDAEVLVLTASGYVTAAPGRNGFVCLVQRSWFSGLENEEFWNPKERSPICFNQQGARSVLPVFLKRTTWALAGLTKAQIVERTRSEMASGKIRAPETGTLTFMMARNAYLGDSAKGPWRPHVMFFMPRMSTADWAANRPGSPIMADIAGPDPWTLFFVPVPAWSDGTPDTKHPM
jgi:hypothetical protein